MTLTTIAFMAAAILLGLQSRCYAYIDPSAGGFLMQILAPLGALAASAFIYFWKHLVGLFSKKSRHDDRSEPIASDIER